MPLQKNEIPKILTLQLTFEVTFWLLFLHISVLMFD